MSITHLIQKSLPFAGAAALIAAVAAVAIVAAPLLESTENLAAVSTADVVSLTNEERADEGVATLQRNALLDQAAQMKAQDMAAKGYYAHVSPEGLTPMHWVDTAGYTYLIIGENLVVNRKDAEQVVDAFMGSPGHRANILRKDFTEIGVGVANGVYKGKDATFTVQIFAAPYPRTQASVKPSSTVSKPQAPVATKPAAIVPRASAATSTPLSRAAAAVPQNLASIQERVKEVVRPLFAPAIATTVPATSSVSTSSFTVPSFSLNTAVPIELIGVSQLEAETLPVPLGSTWTMELRAFVESVVLSARGLFVR